MKKKTAYFSGVAGEKNARHRHGKRLLAAVLSASMLVTLMPLTTFVEGGELPETIAESAELSESLEEGTVLPETVVQGSESIGEPAPETVNDESGTVRAFAGSTRLTKSFTSKSKGYKLSFPSDAYIRSDVDDFDARVDTSGCVLQITKEWSPYLNPADDLAEGISRIIPDFKWKDGKDQYFGYYQSRFILNKDWQQNNGVSVSDVENISAGGYKGMMYSAVISDMPDDQYDGYTYIFIKLQSYHFLRIVAKYHSNGSDPGANGEQISLLKSIASSLSTFTGSGSSVTKKTDFKPQRSTAWSEETQAMYDRIQKIGTSESQDDSLLWGIYTDHVMEQGLDQKIPELEKKLNYQFGVVLGYVHYNGGIPALFMKKAWEQGKMVELTYQLTENNNENLFADSVSMRLYRKDPATIERIRQFARDAKALEHPFLFRLCNEMNSDWTSYGGVVNMADPDIFAENWRTIYRIFQEEGVDNCIWVYNPNNRNAPPDEWNGALNYYPGNEYVDLIGVTGYNTGTYYYSRWREEWRGFTEIYDDIQDYYGKYFRSFPWMITEFSTSSVGGDKPAWIRSMFDNIGKYRNIKIAVWFSSADYDEYGNVARPYWMDETYDTLMAFRKGLSGSPCFWDLGGSEWATDAIYEVTDAGYFTGTSDTTFDPSMDMSRAMIFTVIARMAGVDTATGTEWYDAGMQWAMEQGITDGTNPFDSITREQMVTMLYRYATGEAGPAVQDSEPEDGTDDNPEAEAGAAENGEPDSVNAAPGAMETGSADDADDRTAPPSAEMDEDSAEPANQEAGAEKSGLETIAELLNLSILAGFADADTVSKWALKAMLWAVENGIIAGDDRGYLDPQGTATRAQVATIISRFVKL